MQPNGYRLAVIFLCGFIASSVAGATPENGKQWETVHFDSNAERQNNSELQQLLTKADALQLHQNDHWLRLLHFEPQRFGSTRSLIDGPDFFVSKNGQTDARAELRATLAAFFSTQPLPPSGLSAQCKYVARYHWLNEQLNFTSFGIEPQRCEAYERYINALDPAGITVIFASSHAGRPASMFGHTLLRIDKKNQTDDLKMLAWSVNYSADSSESSGPISYVMGGVAGGFPGKFALMPYYLKMREYGQMEDRTIWEYKLKLNQQQVNTIARHTYEMASTWSSYYFFTENCSYSLLTLLDVALPGPRVSAAMKRWVLPADTIITLDKADLIDSVKRSPGYSERVRARRKNMPAAEQQVALQLSKSDNAKAMAQLHSLPVERQARVLDLAYDYRRYRRIRDTGELNATLDTHERKLLALRAKLGGRSEEPAVPATTRPDHGHRSQRVEAGIGQAAGINFASLGWRGSYHDTLDPQAGFRRNSRLEIFDVQARIYREAGANRNQIQLKLDHLDVLDILSLEPSDSVFQHVSWNAKAGIGSAIINGQSRTVATLGSGAGRTWALAAANRWVGYAMMDFELDYATFLHSDYQFSVGPRLGIVGQLAANSRLHIEGRQRRKVAGDSKRNHSLNIGFSQRIQPNLNLKIVLSREQTFGQQNDNFLLSVQRYY